MEQKEITIYAWSRGTRCRRVERLFRRKGYRYEVVGFSSEGELSTPLAIKKRRRTAPQVFIDGRLAGDFGIIRALDRSGDLDRLVRGEV